MKKMNGFTIIEAMVTLIILAVLVGLGMPALTTSIQNNRVVTQMNELTGAFALARGEAVSRGIPVMVTPNSSDFAQGWCVHTGNTCDDTTTISVHDPLVNVKLITTVTSVRFSRLGQLSVPATDAVFTLQPPTCSGLWAHKLTIIGSGRPSVVRKQNCV